MKVTKRILSLLLVCVMLFALAACNNPQDGTTGVPGTTGNGNTGSDKATYTVKLTTAGGMALAGYQVLIYDDPACAASNIVEMGTTDSNGVASWSLTKGKEYYIQLDSNTLKGYALEPYYTFNGTTANLTLTSSLIKGEDPAANVFEIGDVMYDFTFTSTDGETITLSEVLAERDLVVLNFWYTTCSNCLDEFPVLDKAYDQVSESIEILGLNSYARDNEAAVGTFEADYNMDLSFPLGKVDNNFNPQKFINPRTGSPAEGYPTSVFIDRYGVICLIEVGAMTSLTEWNSVLNHFIGDDYKQKVVQTADELITRLEAPEAPNTMEEIAGVFTGEEGLDVTYRWEADDVYSWPYKLTEKGGVSCIAPMNTEIYESYAILYADVYMEEGDVLAFDYWASTEAGCDILYVIVDGQAIYSLSGLKDGWQSAYCWIADKAGTYELALCYQKDTDTDEGDDCVYLKNLRTVKVEDIDTPSYLPREAATMRPDGNYDYVNIVLNKEDGYYHVGTVDGPLLLAGLYDFTQFSEEEYIYLWAANGDIVINGKDSYADYVEYFSAATNSNLIGWCPVTEELAGYLKAVADIKGYLGDKDEWLLFCKYYDAYGTNGEQLEDPVAGLKTWSALTAVEGVDVETNVLNYNGMPLIPRGKLARFTPTRSGVYRITSSTNYNDTLDAWIFDEDCNMLYEYQRDEMMNSEYVDDRNVTMVMYMEAGVDYYIDIAPYDVYAICDVWYDIIYIGETYEVFKACSPGPFISVEGSTDYVQIRGIKVVLNPEDGYYHEDLGRDAAGNQIYGSIVYAYFNGGTVSFSNALADRPVYNEDGTPKLDENGNPVVVKGLISMGAFDFSKDEYDDEILSYLRKNNNDQEATLEELRSVWGDDFDANYAFYRVEEVFAGIYHGEAGDCTAEMQSYLDKIIDNGPDHELTGCVPVDARLAELLHMAMDKYTFKGVVNAWQKFCFYYDYLGSKA